MDDKGFIFTADATLALVVVIVFTASILVYGLLPVYQGQDHQHLQALADSALATMEQDGTLRDAAVYYANNNSTAAQSLLTNSLNSILPSDVSYKMTMSTYTPQAINNRGRDYSVASDVATGVRVISGPQDGWLGRSFYNIKEVGLIQQDTNVTTTLWNFHNWLTNFNPWSWNDHLEDYRYWGYSGGSYQNIAFSVPNTTSSTGRVNWARIIVNSVDKTNRNPSPYSANVVVNGNSNQVTDNQFLPQLYTYSNYHFYNHQRLINVNTLTPGATNNLYINYGSVTSTNDMAWFSLIANYTVSMVVPQGVVTKNYNFNDAAGLAYPNPSTWPNYPDRVSGIVYNLLTGASSTFTDNNGRYTWNNYITNHPNIANGHPFVLTGVPSGSGSSGASAIAIEKEIDNSDSGDIKDAYVTMNPYGAVDGAMVEVYRPPPINQWVTVFRSDQNTQSGTDRGYGNLPGTIYLKDYMDKGRVNKVRITIWDLAPGVDYDLVGLTNCYAVVSSSKLPIWWDNYPTVSDQSSTNQIQKNINYEIRSNQTKESYLFFSGGMDTKTITVRYNTGELLYNGAAPYLLNLGELDAGGPKKMTNGTTANHTYIPGNYTIQVTVNSGQGWESGDPYAEIFSGTRVAVIYPALEHAVWSTSYAPTAQQAIDQAYQMLISRLNEQGFYNIDPNLVYNESMYTGDLPNSIPVRLDLWTY